MNLEAIRKIAADNMAKRRSHLEREPGHVYHHGLRTANLAVEIMSRVSGDSETFDQVLYTGALFHDVGKGFSSHHEVGARLAKELLADTCSEAELERICDIVRFHCIRKRGHDLETGVLAVQDADIIDHFGTQEIWLNFLYRAYNHQTQLDAIRHWESSGHKSQIIKLRELLNFDFSRELFDERVRFQELFLHRLKAESEGRVPDRTESTGS